MIEPNRGARVRPIDEDFVRDIIEIEVLIEPALTRWFVSIVDLADIERLEAVAGRDRGARLRRPRPARPARHPLPPDHLRPPLQPPRRRAVVEAPRDPARDQPPLPDVAQPPPGGDPRAPRADRADARSQDADGAAAIVAAPRRGLGAAHHRADGRGQAPGRTGQSTEHEGRDDDHDRRRTIADNVRTGLGPERAAHHRPPDRHDPRPRLLPDPEDRHQPGRLRPRRGPRRRQPRHRAPAKHLLVGQNPCNVDYLFKMIANYGGDSREAGGVCGIEIALMDLVGKVYGIPCYQLLGGKYRDKVRLYGDTPAPRTLTPEGFVEVVMTAQGARPHLHQVRPAAAALRDDAGRAGRPGDRARILAVQAVVRPRPRRRRADQPGRRSSSASTSPAPSARRSATRSRSAPTISARASAPPTRRSGSARRSSPSTSPGSRIRCPGPTSPATRRSPTRSSPRSPPARTGTPGTASARRSRPAPSTSSTPTCSPPAA